MIENNSPKFGTNFRSSIGYLQIIQFFMLGCLIFAEITRNEQKCLEMVPFTREQFVKYKFLTVNWLRAAELCRNVRPEVFCKKGVLENFAIFTGKHLGWSFFLIKLHV